MTFESNSPSGDASPTLSLRDSGAALLREGRFTEAANMLTDAVEMDPQDEGAWRLLGGALASTGNYERAVPAFERAINLAPDNARNYYNVALAYQATQRMEDARTAVAKSVSLDSTYAPAQQLLQTMGGAPMPTPTAPPTPASLGMGLGGNPNSPITPIPTPASPSAAPLPSAPSGSPTGMSGLGAIGGGGFGAVGGGAAPTAPPSGGPGGVGGAPGGLSSVGGGGTPYGQPVGAPPPYTPPGAQGGYAPQQSGFTPPPGGYVPPQGYGPPQPQLGFQGGMGGPDVKASEIMTMAIVGFFCFGFILGPVAFVRANKALQMLDQYPGADQSKRGTLNAARVIAIIVTVLSIIGVIARIAMLASSSSSSH